MSKQPPKHSYTPGLERYDRDLSSIETKYRALGPILDELEESDPDHFSQMTGVEANQGTVVHTPKVRKKKKKKNQGMSGSESDPVRGTISLEEIISRHAARYVASDLHTNWLNQYRCAYDLHSKNILPIRKTPAFPKALQDWNSNNKKNRTTLPCWKDLVLKYIEL